MADVRRRGIVSGGRNTIVFNEGTLIRGISWFHDHMTEELRQILEDFAVEVEAYMKANAVWEDRTGDARGGLQAQTYERGKVLGLELSHGVDYGIWLEIRFGGEYAIIIPTLEVMGPEMMARVSEVFNRLP